MMNSSGKQRYVFVGNRGYILREMLKKGLDVAAVWVMEGSPLHKRLKDDLFVAHTVVSDKAQLLELIEQTGFDILISNGCKYILPVSKLKKALYVNIHPSFLPDLKGKNPINGAILFDRDAGAACHIMDDGIDTGKIISRVRVPVTDDIDAAILYQLCFRAEVQVFQEAYDRKFIPLDIQPSTNDAIYYSASSYDWIVRFDRGFDHVLRQVRAFGHKSKGLFFKCNTKILHFFRAIEIKNPFVIELCRDYDDLQVALVFDDSLVFKFEGRIMRFDQIVNVQDHVKEGDYILECQENDIRGEYRCSKLVLESRLPDHKDGGGKGHG